jgi:hypothetical protein
MRKKSEDGLEAYIGLCLLIVSLYTGLLMLYQLLAYFLIFGIAKKFLDSKASLFIETIAVQASLVVFIFIYLLQIYYVEQYFYISNVFEITANIFTLTGLIWLIRKPSLNPIIMLSVFQSILIIIGLVEMYNMEVGTLFHKAFANAIFWRFVSLVLMWLAYFGKFKTIDSRSQ